ncbi:transposase [Pseudidiomarina salilacus]|uniref:transposase n=1 Tax=Pseudidiomarina salilacus TaxID=3384452 RepID=UPI003984F413
MPNRKRNDVPGIALHITQRGNNRQRIFKDENDCQRFAGMLIRFAKKYEVAVHAWVFMPNHIHLLVTPNSRHKVGRMMMCLTGCYTRYYNAKYHRTGTLYEKRFFSSLVGDDEYAITVYRYIELNPVKARLTRHPRSWHWSSYRHNAEGLFSKFLQPHKAFLQLGRNPIECRQNYRKLVNATKVHSREYRKLLNTLRATQLAQGAFGSDDFIEAMSARLGRKLKLKLDED